MTQTMPGAFALIENMASSSLNKNKEHDCSKSVSSIDDLAAKVDQLLKNSQNQVFIMEEAVPEKSVGDLTLDTEAIDDQQEVSYVNGQGWQLKNYHPNPNARNNPQVFWPKQNKPAENAQGNQGQYPGYQKNYQPRAFYLNQPQNNQSQKQQNTQQTAPATTSTPQDDASGVTAMLQQFLQGQHIQGKALNQVTTDINARMNHMFNDLSTKYDNVASHMRQMDIQIAQTAENVKRQQGTLPGKTDKNPKEGNRVQLRSGRNLQENVPRRLTTAEKGKQKEGERSTTGTAPLDTDDAEQTPKTDPSSAPKPAEQPTVTAPM